MSLHKIIKHQKEIDSLINEYKIYKNNYKKIDRYFVNRIINVLNLKISINKIFDNNEVSNRYSSYYPPIKYLYKQQYNNNNMITIEELDKKLKIYLHNKDIVSSLKKVRNDPNMWIKAYINSKNDKDRFELLKWLKNQDKNYIKNIIRLLKKDNIDIELG